MSDTSQTLEECLERAEAMMLHHGADIDDEILTDLVVSVTLQLVRAYQLGYRDGMKDGQQS